MIDIEKLEQLAKTATSGLAGDRVMFAVHVMDPEGILALTAEVRRLRSENDSLALARLSGDSPKRAVTLELEMQADTARDLVSTLYNFATQVDRYGISRNGVSGGCHSGYTYTYAVNDAPSHDEYFAAVDVWLAARKAEKEGV